MKPKWGVILFAFTEILIGSVTLLAVILSIAQGKSAKPTGVLIFVLVTAYTSIGLGLGMLRRNLICYYLLLYFSSIIILSKLLIFAKVIALNGALETALPSSLKNTVSVIYHVLLIFYFTHKPVRKQFSRQL